MKFSRRFWFLVAAFCVGALARLMAYAPLTIFMAICVTIFAAGAWAAFEAGFTAKERKKKDLHNMHRTTSHWETLPQWKLYESQSQWNDNYDM